MLKSVQHMNEVNLGFWKELKQQTDREDRPIFVLAPMADVTDASFRHVIAKYGKPDVTWTEFVSADGLIRAHEEGKKKLLRDLVYSEAERPIIAQLFSSHPQYMYEACKLVAELGFDGIDINMGCPDKSIEKQGCGSAMIKNPENAKAVILAAKKGVEDAGEKTGKIIPISVKTRIGYNKDELETWLPALLEARPAVITIHARTRKEMSKVPARWEHVKRAVEIRNEFFIKNPSKNPEDQTLIFGNGDVLSIADGYNKAKETGADGVMLGRAIFGNPWLFSGIQAGVEGEWKSHEPTVKEKLEVMVEHTKLFEELLGDIKNFAIMKKHYKAYVNGFDGAKELREELMMAEDAKKVEEIVSQYLK